MDLCVESQRSESRQEAGSKQQDAAFTKTADFEKIEADAYIGNLRKTGSDS